MGLGCRDWSAVGESWWSQKTISPNSIVSGQKHSRYWTSQTLDDYYECLFLLARGHAKSYIGITAVWATTPCRLWVFPNQVNNMMNRHDLCECGGGVHCLLPVLKNMCFTSLCHSVICWQTIKWCVDDVMVVMTNEQHEWHAILLIFFLGQFWVIWATWRAQATVYIVI